MATGQGKIQGRRVDLERVRRDILELAAIGVSSDDRGIYRMAFTEADMQAREWLVGRIRSLGLAPRVDGAGNISAVLPGRRDGPAVLVGSHIDTVPGAGALDGTLGVVTGLECLRCIRESGQLAEHPIELVAFSDEEGRFGGLLGSQAFCGQMNPDMIHRAVDVNGVTLEAAMREHGFDPMQILEARRDPTTIRSYLELHIEQGPVLDNLRKPIGIVKAITGLFKWIVSLHGEANHAGTTPMEMRKDALMGLADFAHEIPRLLDENGGEQSRATIGKAEILPGAPNTVPGHVEFSVDVRDVTVSGLNDLADSFKKALFAITRRRGLSFKITEQSFIQPVPCDEEIVTMLKAAADRLELGWELMPSGAAHDAQILGSMTKTAMIFVPSKGGKSHSPAEWTDWEDIESGANLLLAGLGDLAGIGGENN